MKGKRRQPRFDKRIDPANWQQEAEEIPLLRTASAKHTRQRRAHHGAATDTDTVTVTADEARARGLDLGRVITFSRRFCEVAPEGADPDEADTRQDIETLSCRLTAALAARQKAALAVGDRVALLKEGDDIWVTGVLPRKTVLDRPDPRNPNQRKVLVANVDVVVIVAAARRPDFTPGLIDRYLIAVERGGAAPLLCLNKVDLLDEPTQLPQAVDLYRRLGLPVISASAKAEHGLDDLRRALAGKLCAFVGHSGVGKSSLLNALRPDLDLRTSDVRASDGTGRHTTTRSTLYSIGHGTRVIDTPGVRELGLWELTFDELCEGFPEFLDIAAGCRFSNCRHLREPDCAVREAVEEGQLSADRFATYLRLLNELEGPPGP